MSFQHYRGVRISLVSRSDIRYEGTLDDVNPDTSSIALTSVRSFGTEGRKGNPMLEVAPQDKVFPYICFRASDVKDLNVLETPAAAPKLDDAPPADPAIIDYQPPKAQQDAVPVSTGSSARKDRSASRSSRSRSRSPQPRRQHHHHHQHQNREHHMHHHHNHQRGDGPAEGYRGGRGGGYRGGRGGGGIAGANRPVGPVIPKGEFNFDESNAKLDKEAVAREFAKMTLGDDESSSDVDDSSDEERQRSEAAKKADKVVIPPRENFYDKKSSFFDNISCEAKERAERGGNMDYQQRRQRIHQERRTNMETFGVSTAGYRGGYRGGHRGGYRGGHRGGYDGGRGGQGNYDGGRGGYRGGRDHDNVQA